MPTLTGIPRVLLLIETSDNYGRRILEGIGCYVREHGPWSLYCEARSLEAQLPPWVGQWRGEGILARSTTAEMAHRLRGLGAPLVELLGCEPDQPGKVHGDNASAGQLAAEHLLECGLRNFGFFAYGEAWWIAMYAHGFQATLEMYRCTCDVYRPPRSNVRLLPKWRSAMQPQVAKWLKSLPKPVGIFAPSPDYAATLLNVCRSEGIAVPEQIAVISGVDDPPLCNVFTPTLSSADVPAERVGYEAAAMLAGIMAGGKPAEHTVWIPASHVVVRQSSDLVAIDDAEVAGAVRFIRQQACQGIRVPDVLQEVGVSRRVLERKFQKFLGHTPKEEILKFKLDRAKLLLSHSEMSIEVIARKSGFPSFKHLATVFRREVGVTPRTFRKTNRIRREE